MADSTPNRLIGISAPAFILALACALAAPARAQDVADDPHAGAVAAQWGLIETYCVECHNFSDWAGEVAFDTMDPEAIADDAAVWEQAVRKLRGGLMPPPGEPHPGHEEVAAFAGALEAELDAAAMVRPDPGRVDLHRLNRKEYANAVRDLLGVEIDAESLLPPDDSAAGFDNIASALTVTPTFLEQYVGAARTVALTAIGDGDARPGSAIYTPAGGSSSRRHIEGLPLGTRGGIAARHYFPADGEYVINISDMAQALWVYNMEFENTVVVTLDGAPIYTTEIGGDEDTRAIDQEGVGAADYINQRLKNINFTATAGPHDVGVAFVARTFAESDQRLRSEQPGGGVDTLLNIQSFEIRGPFNPAGATPAGPAAQIITCTPQTAAEALPCAERILEPLVRRAWRRPVTDADMAPLLAFYRQGAAAGEGEIGDHAGGVRQALTAILASPDFLYRFAAIPDDLAPGDIYTLNDLELASRLSFFLWSSIPDDELLDAAIAGNLREPDVLEAQVRRMLADPRAMALVTGFAFQWLEVDKLDDVIPEGSIFPAASGGGDPRAAYREELALFIQSIVREDRPVMDFLTADHTYLNERAALLYGMTDVRGGQFRRVTLTDPARFGLLGKGAVLMATSYPNRTAPVLRGKFILQNFMGAPPNPPPAGVDTDLTETAPTEKPLTVRERMVLHRADPSCNSCHGVMDPLGLALENFDAVAMWRDMDLFAGQPIDSSGELPDGTQLAGPLDLRAALVAEPERFARTFTEEMLTFALGRTMTHHDMPLIRDIVHDAAADDYRISAIVRGIVASDAFRMMRAPDAPAEQIQEASIDGETTDGHP